MSDRKLCDSDYILFGKGLKFCPKPKSHDKIKLAEETFNYTRRQRLKEYFYENITKKEEDSESNMYKQMPFFNKKKSTLTPPSGRDTNLDFYSGAVTQEILRSSPKHTVYSNISKEEMNSLRSLSQDDSIVIKNADKSNMVVIMNKTDYIKEIERQLTDEKYYTRLDENP